MINWYRDDVTQNPKPHMVHVATVEGSFQESLYIKYTTVSLGFMSTVVFNTIPFVNLRRHWNVD